MRKRYQRGSVTKSTDGRYWVGKYREHGRHRTKLLGKIREITKSQAREKFAEVLNDSLTASSDLTLRGFVEDVYFPFYRRKWKESTYTTNRDRIQREIVAMFGNRDGQTVSRDELQEFLDSKSSLSFSTVDHLRWDLSQIFRMATAEGLVRKNPASMLFTPRECAQPNRPCMTVEELKRVFAVLDLRERLICKLAVLGGLRPGEILGLRRSRLTDNSVAIHERIYRGRLDSPKSRRSVRQVPLSGDVRKDLEEWLSVSPNGSEGWLFPSERLDSPLSTNNVLYRYIRPRLAQIGLGWVNFQVMRRTHSSLMRELGVDPKVVADLMGTMLVSI